MPVNLLLKGVLKGEQLTRKCWRFIIKWALFCAAGAFGVIGPKIYRSKQLANQL
jgi:hypothetical protein